MGNLLSRLTALATALLWNTSSDAKAIATKFEERSSSRRFSSTVKDNAAQLRNRESASFSDSDPRLDTGRNLAVETMVVRDGGVGVNYGTVKRKHVLMRQSSKEELDLEKELKIVAEDEKEKSVAWNQQFSDVLSLLGGCSPDLLSSLVAHGLDDKLAQMLNPDLDADDFSWKMETVLRWCPDTESALNSVMQERSIAPPLGDGADVRCSEPSLRLNKVRFRLALCDRSEELSLIVKEEMCAAVNLRVCKSKLKTLKEGNEAQYILLMGLLRKKAPDFYLDLLDAFLHVSMDHRNNEYILGSLPKLPDLRVARSHYEDPIRMWLKERAAERQGRRPSVCSSSMMVLTGLEGVGKTMLVHWAAMEAMEVGFDWVVLVCLQQYDVEDDPLSEMARVLKLGSSSDIRSHILKLQGRGERCLAVVDDLRTVPPAELDVFTAVLVTGCDKRFLEVEERLQAAKHLPVLSDLTETDVRLLYRQMCERQLRKKPECGHVSHLEETDIVEEVVRLCSDLHFNPMAVGLVLSQVGIMASKIVSRQTLSKYREKICGVATTASERLHETVHASVELLDEVMKECYLRLSVLDGSELHFTTATRLWEDVGDPDDVLQQLIDLHLLLPARENLYLLHGCCVNFLERETKDRREEFHRVVFKAYSGDPKSVPDDDLFFHRRFVHCCLQLKELDAALSVLSSLERLHKRFSLSCGRGVVNEMEETLRMMKNHPRRQQLISYLEVVRCSATEPQPADAMLHRALLRSRGEAVFQEAQRMVGSEFTRQPFLRLGHAPDLQHRCSLRVWREIKVPGESDSAVTSFDFDADRQWLLVGFEKGQVFLIDVDGQLLYKTHYYCYVHLVRFVNSDVVMVATASEVWTLKIKESKREYHLAEWGKELLDDFKMKKALTSADLAGRSLWIFDSEFPFHSARSFEVDVERGGFQRKRHFVFFERWDRLLVAEDGRRAVVSGDTAGCPVLLMADEEKKTLPIAGRALAWAGPQLLLLAPGPVITALNVDTLVSHQIRSPVLTEPLVASEWKGRFLIVAGDWCQSVGPDGGLSSPQRLSRQRPGAPCLVFVGSDRLGVYEESGVIQLYDLSKETEGASRKDRPLSVTPVDAISGQPLAKEMRRSCTGRRAVAARWIPSFDDVVVAVVEDSRVRVHLAGNRQVLLDQCVAVPLAGVEVELVMIDDRLALAVIGDTTVREVNLNGQQDKWLPGSVLGLAVSVERGSPSGAGREEVVAAVEAAKVGCRVTWRHSQPDLELAGDGRGWRLLRFLPVAVAEGRAVLADAHMSMDWRRLTVSTCTLDTWRTAVEVTLHSNAAQPYAVSHDAARLAVVDRRGKVQVWDLWKPSLLHDIRPHDAVGEERLVFTASALVRIQSDSLFHVLPTQSGGREGKQGRFQFRVCDTAWLQDEKLLLASDEGDCFYVVDLATFVVFPLFRTEWGNAPRRLSVLAVAPDCKKLLMQDSERQLLLLVSTCVPIGDEGTADRRCVVS